MKQRPCAQFTYRAGAGLPVGRADFAVLVGELEGANEAQSLLNAAAHGVVVDLHAPNRALGVDHEQTAAPMSISERFRNGRKVSESEI